MIVAYLILAHANPAQLARLVAALPAESPVFVHVDARAPAATYRAMIESLAGRPGLRFVARHACRWGDAGIVRGTLSLMAAADAAGGFDYATLLSGADYPIKSNAAIAAFLTAADGAEFIESFPLRLPNRWSGQAGPFRAPDRMLRYHLRFRSRVLATPWMRTLPDGLEPHGGSQWWTLTRAAVAHVAGHARDRPRLLRFVAHSVIPDESYVQTVLSASPMAGRIAGDDLRLSVWDRPEPPYPATLRSADLDLLTRSPQLFARKFDDRVDPAVFDLIDAQLRAG